MALNEKTMKGSVKTFACDMKKLMNQKDSSDIRFVIGPARKTVYAHRCILAARCEVFRAMFSDQSQKHKDGEVPFVLSDMTLEVFMPLLEYIYTNCVSLTSKNSGDSGEGNATDILGSAIEYGLEGLKQMCVDYLIDTLCVANACEAMQAGVTYGQEELKRKSMEYIEDHTQDVFQTKGFHEMSDTALASVLHSHQLQVDEADVLSAVTEWATVNSVVMGKSMAHVAKKVIIHVRLPLLSPEELKTIESENRKSKIIPVDHVSFAWKYHALKQTDGGPLTTLRRGTRHRDCHDALHNS